MQITLNTESSSHSIRRMLWLLGYALVFAAIVTETTNVIFQQLYPAPEYPEPRNEKECAAFDATWNSLDRYCTGTSLDNATSQYYELAEQHANFNTLFLIVIAAGALGLSRQLVHMPAINYGLIATSIGIPFRIASLLPATTLGPPPLMATITNDRNIAIGYLLASGVILLIGWWEARIKSA